MAEPIIGQMKEQTNRMSSVAANVLERASAFKQRASDTRLGLPTSLNASLVSANKAKGFLAERTAAKKLAEAQSIRIDVHLYTAMEQHGRERLIEVPLPHAQALHIIRCPKSERPKYFYRKSMWTMQ